MEDKHITGEEKDILNVEKNNTKIHHFGMKKSIILIVTAIILIAALIAGYMIFGKKDDDTDKSVKVLFDYDKTDIEKIVIDNRLFSENIVLTPFMNGTTLEWNVEGQKYDDVNQLKCEYIQYQVTHLETRFVFEYDASKLSEYGLDNPDSVVTTTYKDGKTITMYVGDYYQEGGGTYLLIEGINELYVVSSYTRDYLTFRHSDLLSLPQMTKTSSSASNVFIKSSNGILTQLSYIPGPTSGNEEWYILQPTFASTNSESIDGLFESISAVTLSTYYADAVGNDAEKYGFNEPYYEMQSYDASGKLLDWLVVGNKDDEADSYYCVLLSEGETLEEATVYTIKSDQILLIDKDASSVANQFLASINVFWLRSGHFIVNGKKYDLTIDRKPRYDDDGKPIIDENGNESTINTYYINGNQIDDLQFRTFYSKILFLSIEGIVPKDTKKGELLFEYTFEAHVPITDSETGKLFYKDITYIGSYYKISDNYAVYKNNESDSSVFTVRCRTIDSVIQAFSLLLEGKMPTA